MKITHNKVGQNLNLTDTAKAEKAGKAKAAAARGSDTQAPVLEALGDTDKATKVNLSQRAQDAKKAKEIAMAAPDIREDKVAQLQKLIDEGKYNVEAKNIADKMVDEEIAW